MKEKDFKRFRSMVQKGEKTVSFSFTKESGETCRYEFIAPAEMNENGDILSAMKDTLRRMRDAGFDAYAVRDLLGAEASDAYWDEGAVFLGGGCSLAGCPCDYDFGTDLIRQSLYEKYKLHWMAENGYSAEDLVRSVMDFADEPYKDHLLPAADQLKRWEAERGFDGNLWLSFPDFLTDVYPDRVSISQIGATTGEVFVYLNDFYHENLRWREKA